MKKLLLGLLLVTGLSFGQITRDSLDVYISPSYIGVFDELIEQAENYKVDLRALMLLDSIIEVPYLPGVWAIVHPEFHTILITKEIPAYLSTFRKFVLLHEMSHILVGPGHLPPGVGPMVMRSGLDINIEDIVKFYCIYEEDYYLFLTNYYQKY